MPTLQIPLKTRKPWLPPAERDEAYELGRSIGIRGGNRAAAEQVILAQGYHFATAFGEIVLIGQSVGFADFEIERRAGADRPT
jgi:hypothetical protein